MQLETIYLNTYPDEKKVTILYNEYTSLTQRISNAWYALTSKHHFALVGVHNALLSFDRGEAIKANDSLIDQLYYDPQTGEYVGEQRTYTNTHMS